MPATVKATLKADARQDRTHAVRIRITSDRKPRYHNTGIYVLASQWNPKGTYEKENWIKGHPEAGLYNRTIKKLVQEYMALALEHPGEDAEQLIKIKTRPAGSGLDFLQFFSRELERIKLTGNPRTVVRRTALYNKLYEFSGGTVTTDKKTKETTYTGGSLPFEKLSVAFIRNFVTCLQTTHGNAGETIKKEMQVLSGLCKIAVSEGLLDYQKNPMPHIQVKAKPKMKDRLTQEQLNTFAAVELPASRPVLSYARDCFMLQFYLHGARITDVLELRHEGITPDRVTYVMRKTGTIKSIKRSPALNALLDKYPPAGSPFVLPFLKPEDLALPLPAYLKKIESKTAQVNKLLKEVAEKASLKIHITSHVARHTLADIARNKIGMHLLQEMLAHKSLKTTEGYVSSLDMKEMDDADEAVYG